MPLRQPRNQPQQQQQPMPMQQQQGPGMQPGNPALNMMNAFNQVAPNPLRDALGGARDQQDGNRPDPYIQGTRIQNDGANVRSIMDGQFGLANNGLNFLRDIVNSANQYHAGMGMEGLNQFGNLTGSWWDSVLDRGGIQGDQLAEQARQADLQSQTQMQGFLADLLGQDMQGQYQIGNTQQQGYNDMGVADLNNQANLAGMDQTNQLGFQGMLANFLNQNDQTEAGLLGQGMNVWGDLQGRESDNMANLAGMELGANANLLGGHYGNMADLIGGNNRNNTDMFNNMYSTNTGANVAAMNAGLQGFLQDSQLAADADKTRTGREFAQGILGEDFSVSGLLGGQNSMFGRPSGFHDTGSGAYARFPTMTG